MGNVHRKAGAEEGRQGCLDVRQSRRPRRPLFLEHAPGPRVPEHHPSRRHRQLAERGFPVIVHGRSLDLTDDQVGDAIKQVVLAPDVPVHRHRIDPELLPELAHAQRLKAVTIGEADCGLKHPLPCQGCPGLGAGSCANCHLTSVRSSDMFTA